MDVITTDEDVKMEDQIRSIVRQSVFLLVSVLFLSLHAFTCLYIYSCNHSTLL